MPTNYYIGIAIVIVLIVAWWCVARGRARDIDEYITGAWIAPEDFCESAEVDSLMCVFAPAQSAGWAGVSRLGYIIATPDLINCGMTLRYTRGITLSTHKHRLCVIAEFDEAAIDGSDGATAAPALWPRELIIDVDIHDGVMRIHDNTTIYARLYKHHDLSATVRAEYAAGDDALQLEEPLAI